MTIETMTNYIKPKIRISRQNLKKMVRVRLLNIMEVVEFESLNLLPKFIGPQYYEVYHFEPKTF